MKTFKRILLLAAGMTLPLAVSAQNFSAAKIGLVEENGVTTLSYPQTTVTVTLVVEKETTVAGPYARFAQKYLGVRAPLTDRTVYHIAEASITASDAAPKSVAAEYKQGVETVSLRGSDDAFPKVLPDKLSSSEQVLEEAAKKAASTIFSMRRNRIDLITGMVGENVFGAGLDAALKEIDRIEQEYLELFLGKQTVETKVRTITVVPEASKTKYIICRFSDAEGVVSANNLSAQPIVLEFVPSGNIPTAGLAIKGERESRSAVPFCIADNVVCRLSDGTTNFAEAELPIFQYGRVVEIVNPQKK